MVKINIAYEGELRSRATHGPSGTTLITDAPVDNQGKGQSFSPTDLVATALGSCMVTIMGIVANRHHIDLKGLTASVEKEMVNEPIRKIGTLRVTIKGPVGLKASDQKMLEKAALTCPVHQSLHPEIKQEIRFQWLS